MQSFNAKKKQYDVVNTRSTASDTKDPQAVNIRAMMAVFYNGIGPQDIGNTM